MKSSDSYYLGRSGDIGWLVNPSPDTPAARDLDIRIQAHRLWESAGQPVNRDQEFWFQAEREFEEMAQGW